MIKKNIGIIGCGNIAIEYLKVLKKIKYFNIYGITSKTNKNCIEVARKFSINKVFKNYYELSNDKNIDIIFILVSYKSIYEVCSKVIKFQKPFFLEKPPGLSLNQANKLYLLSTKFKVKNMVGFNRRYYSIFEKGKKIITSRGKLLGLSIEGHERAWNKKFNLNNWFFANSIHTIDLINYFGGEVKEKSIYTKRYNKLISNIALSFIFKSGAIGTYQSFWHSPGGWSVTLYGEGVTVIFKPLENGYYLLTNSNIPKSIKPDNKDLIYKPGFYKQMKIFEDYIANNKRNVDLQDLKSSFKTMQLMDKILHT